MMYVTQSEIEAGRRTRRKGYNKAKRQKQSLWHQRLRGRGTDPQTPAINAELLRRREGDDLKLVRETVDHLRLGGFDGAFLLFLRDLEQIVHEHLREHGCDSNFAKTMRGELERLPTPEQRRAARALLPGLWPREH